MMTNQDNNDWVSEECKSELETLKNKYLDFDWKEGEMVWEYIIVASNWKSLNGGTGFNFDLFIFDYLKEDVISILKKHYPAIQGL